MNYFTTAKMNKKKISKVHYVLLKKKIRRENLLHTKEISFQRINHEEENSKIKPQMEVNILVHLKIGIITLNQKFKN